MIRFLGRSDAGLFASRSVAGHLIRGVAAGALLWFALEHAQTRPWGAATAGLGALFVMRGCPMCWAIGLLETIGQRVRRRPVGISIDRDP